MSNSGTTPSHRTAPGERRLGRRRRRHGRGDPGRHVEGDPGGVERGDLLVEAAEDAGVADNVASEHLRLMQQCGFFQSEKQGRRVYYRVAESRLQQLMSCIESRFLAGGSGR